MPRSLCLIGQRNPTIPRTRLPRWPLKTHIGQPDLAGDIIAALGNFSGERMGRIQHSPDGMALQKRSKTVTAAEPTMIGRNSQLLGLARRSSQAGTGSNIVICAKLSQLPGIARTCEDQHGHDIKTIMTGPISGLYDQ